jgi:hypothetical protein
VFIVNKIIVVGHPNSGVEDIKKLLVERGMSEALPSRREGLSPNEITRLLCQAHGAILVEDLQKLEDFSFVKVEPVWQGLALDLVLANLQSSLWGWADSQTLSLLEYWKSLDSQVIFILVYDSPEKIYHSVNFAAEMLTEEQLQLQTNNWFVYNKILLDFYLENSDRSILVHSEQVKYSIQSYIQKIESHIDVSLTTSALKNESLICASDSNRDLVVEGKNSLLPQSDLGLDLNRYTVDPLVDYLTNQLFSSLGNITCLYDELQSVADLPLAELDEIKSKDIFSLWSTLQDQKKQAYIKNQMIEHKNQELSEALKCLHELESTAAVLNRKILESEKENKQVVAQFYLLQEELENYYKKNKLQQTQTSDLKQIKITLENSLDDHVKLVNKIEQKLETLKKSKSEVDSVANWQKIKIEDLRKLKDEQAILAKERATEIDKLKSERVEYAKAEIELKNKIENLNRDLKESRKKNVDEIAVDENLLVKQLYNVQQQLEKYYIENQALKKSNTTKAVPKVAAPKLEGAVDRFKEELPYKVGSTIIKQSKSVKGMLTLPYTLVKLKKESVLKSELEKKLPPLSDYSDAQDIEKLKNHLSYKVGYVLVNEKNSFQDWIRVPYELSRELLKFRRGVSKKS